MKKKKVHFFNYMHLFDYIEVVWAHGALRQVCKDCNFYIKTIKEWWNVTEF